MYKLLTCLNNIARIHLKWDCHYHVQKNNTDYLPILLYTFPILASLFSSIKNIKNNLAIISKIWYFRWNSDFFHKMETKEFSFSFCKPHRSCSHVFLRYKTSNCAYCKVPKLNQSKSIKVLLVRKTWKSRLLVLHLFRGFWRHWTSKFENVQFIDA